MEKCNLPFQGFSMYYRVMKRRKFGEHERSVEVARGAACHYNTRTKRESLKILVVLSTCNYKTALIDVLYFHIAGPLV